MASTAASPSIASTTQQQTVSHDAPSPSGLNGVARRDYETTNLPQVAAASPPNGRRSSSRDHHAAYSPSSPGRQQRRDGPPPASSSDHRRTDSRMSRQRYSADVSRSHSQRQQQHLPSGRSNSRTGYTPDASAAHSSSSAPPKPRARTSLDMPETGRWLLQKTIGAGSMGKVKLAKHVVTGEQCALKIVARQSTEEYRSQRERERADHSKDIRTAREAAIVKLLRHPYICGLRDVLQTNNHWYMLFEYVNGGQMLDYIISHGRLKEKQARTFARQIASALDYCHKNSIVHRDLKIENILISKTGDIKIIDFGLSNLYSPGDLLKTFCGSLYFAAPELLNAQHYDGPEVDVWSFGIVLYVLVCGKVPFDDQSMPQLHAKIKKGQVDYPNWLSMECKHLLSRMLVTDRKNRAPLSEIMQHPWLNKNHNFPVKNYLPYREALSMPLDDEIIERMSGFEFGTPEQIKEKLTQTIESEKYQLAARLSRTENMTPSLSMDRRRGVFDFYKRRNSTASRDSMNASTDALNSSTFDPLNAFSKELSIYYLAREKLERERAPKTPATGSVASPQLGDPLKTPDLAEPKAAFTNASTYEQPGEKPTGGRSRPRARTHGEDDAEEAMGALRINPPQPVQTPIATPTTGKRESVAGGILRRFSTRKPKDRGLSRNGEYNDAGTTPTLQPPNDLVSTPRRGFSIRKNRTRNVSASPNGRAAADHLAPPEPSNPVTRAGARLLGRSSSVNSADLRRRRFNRDNDRQDTGVAGTSASNLDPPQTSGSEHSSVPRVKISEPSAADKNAIDPNDVPKASLVQRSATSARTKSLGHARRESMQARRARRNGSRNTMEAGVPEETEQDLIEADQGTEFQGEMKPVFLKGLFSVSTTSSKPVAIIRADIIRVLRELEVDYTEIKGGFSCIHSDSDRTPDKNSEKYESSRQSFSMPFQRRRISFHGVMGSKDSNHGEGKPARSTSRHGGSPSATEESDLDRVGSSGGGGPSRRRRSATGRAAASAAAASTSAGETTTNVQNPDAGQNMELRFEIFVVKVPLFTLHGIQFKKVSGGTWKYKDMAQKILNALRL